MKLLISDEIEDGGGIELNTAIEDDTLKLTSHDIGVYNCNLLQKWGKVQHQIAEVGFLPSD